MVAGARRCVVLCCVWCFVVRVADGGSPAGALVGEAGVGPGAGRCGAVRCGAGWCDAALCDSALCICAARCDAMFVWFGSSGGTHTRTNSRPSLLFTVRGSSVSQRWYTSGRFRIPLYSYVRECTASSVSDTKMVSPSPPLSTPLSNRCVASGTWEQVSISPRPTASTPTSEHR